MLYAVIMAGGSGTRFWPWSRKKTPKQLLKITGQDTMIKQTVDRIIGEIPSENIYVITTACLADSIKGELSQIPAKNTGCKLVDLGQRTLRVETAAIAVSAILSYHYSN